jgi:Ser/Thr protein kinase RdoA (MazF antagonist)
MCEFRFSLYGLCFSRAFYHVASWRKRRKFAHRVEYLPDATQASCFNEILKLTGKLHSELSKVKCSSNLKNSKLDEYRKRSHLFQDPWFQYYYPDVIQDPIWNYVCQLNQCFCSEKFRILYEQLPSQLIHGDNNQTNIVVSRGEHYFVDFDTIRHDIRLLDLASYFRYGGFDEYIRLSHEGTLVFAMNALYGEKAGPLNRVEERVFHTIVAFSHIEFMSWVLENLKKGTIKRNPVKEAAFREYLRIYMEQLRKLKPLLRERYEKDS